MFLFNYLIKLNYQRRYCNSSISRVFHFRTNNLHKFETMELISYSASVLNDK